MNKTKKTRKFKDHAHYDLSTQDYYLLPFNFKRLNKEKEVIINDIGDLLVIPKGTVKKIIERKLIKEDDDKLYADLIANYFITEERIPPLLDILVTRYRTKKKFLDDFTGLHIFVITLRCEHTCKYCQVSRVTKNKNAFDMSCQHIDMGIDLMMQSPNENLTMEFQGGEPLLAFENIIYAVERAKRLAQINNKKINFVICTNLALIDDDILSYCKKNDILISTSLDGPEFIHNSNRHRPEQNSHAVTIEGIERCKKYLGADKVSALMTTTPLSLKHPKKIVDEYIKQGFHDIFLRNISPYGFAVRGRDKEYDIEQFIQFYKEALNYIIEFNRKGNKLIEGYARIILTKILTPFNSGFVDLQSPAGLINSVIVFNYDGKVYASDEARMLAEMDDDTFLLGNLDDGYKEIFFGEKTEEIAQYWSNETLAGCTDCAYQPFCGADPVFNHATQKDMYGFRPTSDFCKKNMEIIRYLIELMDSDEQIEEIFYNWVSVN